MNVLKLIRDKKVKEQKLKEAQLQMAVNNTCYKISK